LARPASLSGVPRSAVEPREGARLRGRTRTSDLGITMQPTSSPPGERYQTGNRRCCFPPSRAARASNPLGAGAPYRSNRHLHHRRAHAFSRAGDWSRWGTGDPGFPRRERGALLAKRSRPATHRPRRADSTARRIEGGIRTRYSRCEVSEIFTTSDWLSVERPSRRHCERSDAIQQASTIRAGAGIGRAIVYRRFTESASLEKASDPIIDRPVSARRWIVSLRSQ
jgi:hypothetical protein